MERLDWLLLALAVVIGGGLAPGHAHRRGPARSIHLNQPTRRTNTMKKSLLALAAAAAL
jgi:hypothetical protein